jgi:protein-L-isoaspartate(D-aspartate) O-methyltransferase
MIFRRSAERDEGFATSRREMVEKQLQERGIRDPRVLEIMGRVPRHRFVDPALVSRAYGDHALPIGAGQTISQPYMVAIMTEALGLEGGERVLEIGTGSGYQTAVLAEFTPHLFSIERSPELSRAAAAILKELGYTNVILKTGDGTLGWPEHAPYDGIIVTAGAPAIPEPLGQQLAEGGRLVIPVGDREVQTLELAVKRQGKIQRHKVLDCAFVPLLGRAGWRE